MVIDRSETGYIISVRTLLGVDADDSITLPDESITDMTVLDMSEMNVLQYLPADVDLTDTRLKMAVIYTMAATLCPTMPARVDVTVKNIDSGWTRKAVDYEALADKLLAQAAALIDILTPDEKIGESELFRIAPSKRAVNSIEPC